MTVGISAKLVPRAACWADIPAGPSADDRSAVLATLVASSRKPGFSWLMPGRPGARLPGTPRLARPR